MNKSTVLLQFTLDVKLFKTPLIAKMGDCRYRTEISNPLEILLLSPLIPIEPSLRTVDFPHLSQKPK